MSESAEAASSLSEGTDSRMKPLALCKKEKIMMTKNCHYATINSKHYISVNTTPQHIFPVCITLKRADHFAFFDKDMEIFNALCYQLIAGKLKCQM